MIVPSVQVHSRLPGFKEESLVVIDSTPTTLTFAKFMLSLKRLKSIKQGHEMLLAIDQPLKVLSLRTVRGHALLANRNVPDDL